MVFNHYLSFISHPLFQELVPAVRIALDNFRIKHPDFKLPINAPMIAGLDARVKDFISKTNKTSSAPATRSEKTKKNKPPVCIISSTS
jgi:hypothetical protein